MNTGTLLKLAGGIILLLGVGAFLFAWDLARKEVKYLCGNFVEGTSRESVLRQLNTGTQLRYREQPVPPGTEIRVDSAYNFGLYRCVIPLDRTGRVSRSARYETDL